MGRAQEGDRPHAPYRIAIAVDDIPFRILHNGSEMSRLLTRHLVTVRYANSSALKPAPQTVSNDDATHLERACQERMGSVFRGGSADLPQRADTRSVTIIDLLFSRLAESCRRRSVQANSNQSDNWIPQQMFENMLVYYCKLWKFVVGVLSPDRPLKRVPTGAMA